MPNRLVAATSPYLQQHAENPVDWHVWDDEAFAEARRRQVPIFLSVGYSSCHWCHVMAHESFEDDEIAAALNAAFVNVKVDREERPDVDAVYMQAVQAMSGHGGWPMSVFLTPAGEPFFAGTYWPREAGHGMPSFPQVIEAVSEAWNNRRDEVDESASRIAQALAAGQAETAPASAVDIAATDEAAELTLTQAWDRNLGGFGPAPKFPQAMTIEWLLARHARTGETDPLKAAVHSLDAMARGGIHDQIGGGFARYSTDAYWLVPHFEKMLYDNALLLAAYAEAAAITTTDPAVDEVSDSVAGPNGPEVTGSALGEVEPDDLARVARAIAGYLLGELRTDDGMFVSATDADSEGVEGRYFVWTYDDFVTTLTDAGLDAQRWTAFYGVTEAGNFEGANVLHEPVPRRRFIQEHGMSVEQFDTEVEQVRGALLAERAQRVPPGVDDKSLTDWNALAVRALARAGVSLDEPGWVAGAVTAAEALHATHVIDGRLHHSSKHGQLGPQGFFEDHALLALADLELLQATGDTVWLERALRLATEAHERFYDENSGGWFQTAHDAEALITRPKDSWDGAMPAGTSVMVEVALALAGLTGDLRWRTRAEEGIRLFQTAARQMPTGFGWLLRQLEALAAGLREVIIVGDASPERDVLAAVARGARRPGTTVLVVTESQASNGQVPVLAGRTTIDGRPAAYVCQNMTCDLPVTDPEALAGQLK